MAAGCGSKVSPGTEANLHLLCLITSRSRILDAFLRISADHNFLMIRENPSHRLSSVAGCSRVQSVAKSVPEKVEGKHRKEQEIARGKNPRVLLQHTQVLCCRKHVSPTGN